MFMKTKLSFTLVLLLLLAVSFLFEKCCAKGGVAKTAVSIDNNYIILSTLGPRLTWILIKL